MKEKDIINEDYVNVELDGALNGLAGRPRDNPYETPGIIRKVWYRGYSLGRGQREKLIEDIKLGCMVDEDPREPLLTEISWLVRWPETYDLWGVVGDGPADAVWIFLTERGGGFGSGVLTERRIEIVRWLARVEQTPELASTDWVALVYEADDRVVAQRLAEIDDSTRRIEHRAAVRARRRP